MAVSVREEEEDLVRGMNRGWGVQAGGEISSDQCKVLMGILRELNHSCRWFRGLYLVAENRVVVRRS